MQRLGLLGPLIALYRYADRADLMRHADSGRRIALR
jgi:hypothetical protein